MAAEKDWVALVLESLLKNVNEVISVAYLGQITKLTPPVADVQPTAIIHGKKQNIITKVHFTTLPLEYVDTAGDKSQPAKLNYKVGDQVCVLVLDVDNMYFTNSGTFKVDSDRRHAVDFAVVIGKTATASDFK